VPLQTDDWNHAETNQTLDFINSLRHWHLRR